MFNSHLKKVKEIYRTKMQLLQEACELLLPANTHFSKPSSGFYLSISLPEKVTAKQIVHMLNEQHVYVDDASRFFLPEYKKENLIRLSISQVNENKIKLGVERLAHCIALIDSRKKHITPTNFLHL
jgi:DNA-binding transcriptional MocR family regulator